MYLNHSFVRLFLIQAMFFNTVYGHKSPILKSLGDGVCVGSQWEKAWNGLQTSACTP